MNQIRLDNIRESIRFGPVSNMVVNKNTAPNYTYNGTAYYFCPNDERDLFESNPETYLNKTHR